MQRVSRQHDLAEPQVLAHRAEPRRQRHQQHQQDGGRNRCSLEERHLAAAGRELLGRDVVARQARHAAGDKVGQHDAVIEPLHAHAVSDDRRRHAERNDVGERIEFTPQHRRLLPPARDAPVEDVEDQGGQHQAAGEVHMPHVAGLEKGHGGKQRPDAADGIAQREPVRQMELADHREGLGPPIGSPGSRPIGVRPAGVRRFCRHGMHSPGRLMVRIAPRVCPH